MRVKSILVLLLLVSCVGRTADSSGTPGQEGHDGGVEYGDGGTQCGPDASKLGRTPIGPNQHDYDGGCGVGKSCEEPSYCWISNANAFPICATLPNSDCAGMGTGTCACLVANYPLPAGCNCADNASGQAALICDDPCQPPLKHP